MGSSPTFMGFPEAGIEFLANLAAHNNRTWFESHRQEYQTFLLEPAQGLVLALRNEVAGARQQYSH